MIQLGYGSHSVCVCAHVCVSITKLTATSLIYTLTLRTRDIVILFFLLGKEGLSRGAIIGKSYQISV
jgi:hypothetical protein